MNQVKLNLVFGCGHHLVSILLVGILNCLQPSPGLPYSIPECLHPKLAFSWSFLFHRDHHRLKEKHHHQMHALSFPFALFFAADSSALLNVKGDHLLQEGRVFLLASLITSYRIFVVLEMGDANNSSHGSEGLKIIQSNKQLGSHFYVSEFYFFNKKKISCPLKMRGTSHQPLYHRRIKR